jgi:hypothetical protein
MSSESNPTNQPAGKSPGRHVWEFLTSLKLAVVLLALGGWLVYAGTWAQKNEGLYMAQERWFQSWWVIWRDGDGLMVPLIFPGGYTIGVAFLVNVICAHFRRFERPPGGMAAMLTHYALVFGALWLVTHYLLWSPLWLFMAYAALVVVDMAVWRTGSGKKVGVDGVHFGVILLLVGQLGTDLFSVESHMSFAEGESRNYSEHHHDSELVFIRDDEDGTRDKVVAFHQDLLGEGLTLADPNLPFTARIVTYSPNANVIERAQAMSDLGTLRGALATMEGKYATPEQLMAEAKQVFAEGGKIQIWRSVLAELGEKADIDPLPTVAKITADPARAAKLSAALKARFRAEMLDAFRSRPMPEGQFAAERLIAGKEINDNDPPAPGDKGAAQRYFMVPRVVAKGMDDRNMPGAVLEISANGSKLGTWLLSPTLREQKFDVGGKEWRVGLRFERHYHPFHVTLQKTTHEKYEGTEIPKDFRSTVHVAAPNAAENRDRVEISMNNPLRYGGLTFYQHQMGRAQMNENLGTSTLQVVRNPGWFTPYFGCAMVGYGMMRHFLMHMLAFTTRRRKQS